LRENQEDFRSLFWAPGRSGNFPCSYDWDLDELDWLQLPSPTHFWGGQLEQVAPSAAAALAHAQAAFDHSLAAGGIHIDFVHWHWLGGSETGIDTWDAYEEFMEYVSRRDEVHYTSAVRIIEYAFLRHQTSIEALEQGKFSVTLAELPGHRIRLAELPTALTLCFPTPTEPAAVLVNQQERSYQAALADGVSWIEVMPSELPAIVEFTR
jgi:hypothetical protein